MAKVADHRTKIELLRAAEAEFTEHGLAAAKVEDITSRAGVSKGSFYLHWDSKEECWQQVVDGFLVRLAGCIEPPLSLREAPPSASEETLARWREHDRTIFEFCWQNKGLVKMIMAGGGGAPYAYLADEFADRAAKQTEDWVRHAKEAGLYRDDLDPPIVAALMAGAYERLARELIRQPKRPDIEAWCKQVQSIFMHGLVRRPATAESLAEPSDPRVKPRERPSSAGPPKTRAARRRARTL